jgi:hypothetical protein
VVNGPLINGATQVMYEGTPDTPRKGRIFELFEKYKVPIEIDILSEDTDYADYYIVEEILKIYRPKILVHEVNQQPGNLCVTVAKEDKLIFWDGSNYHGGSVCAFWCLAKRFSYTMVYCEKAGVNCFWLRNDLLENNLYNIDHKIIQTNLIRKLLVQLNQQLFCFPLIP